MWTSGRHARRWLPDEAPTALVHGWPALVVVHDADGDWHLLAEHPDGPATSPLTATTRPAPRVDWSRAAAEDPRLRDLVGLPRGWVAYRDALTRPWQRTPG